MTTPYHGPYPTPLIGIIVNLKHGSTKRAYSDLAEGVRELGLHYRTMTTSTRCTGARQADQLVEWGATIIIVFGGDGTIRAAAPTLAEAGILTFLIPTGTANVLSRHIGIMSAQQAIAHCVQTLRTSVGTAPQHAVNIPVNLADTRAADGSWSRHHFLSLAGIGGDGLAVAHHHDVPGLLGYVWGAARALFAADHTTAGRPDPAPVNNPTPYEDATVIIDEPVWSMMASKVACPAGPIAVFPQAHIDRAEFSVLTVGPLPHGAARRLAAWAGIAVACVVGRPEAHPRMRYCSACSAVISLAEPALVQLDGDVLGLCLELRVHTGELGLQISAPAQ